MKIEIPEPDIETLKQIKLEKQAELLKSINELRKKWTAQN